MISPIMGFANRSAMPPNNAGSFMVTTTTGAAVAAIPAPPAGFLTMLHYAVVSNTDVAAGTPQILAGGLPLLPLNSSPGGLESVLIANVSIMTGQATTVQRAAGTSVSMQFRGAYCLVPSRDLVLVSLALTATFQSVASLVPPPGQASKNWQSGFSLANALVDRAWTLLNLDNVGHVVTWRVTRGAQVFTWSAVSVAANARGLVSPPSVGFTFLNGDVVEVKTAEAINTPGSVTLTGCHEFLPAV